ncbi:restriction endonuclease subunit S [Chlorogloea sp. CCALA 695]|uniref:restriction endonuclease subunit S n=1 Tax=Chlorogloea sp. CCALA 695 TaxID=2107693 RepID=UPI0011B20CC0|nr:restriction endonuclease subunit S [Chlorogloea sp. CCALA 695]
MKNKLKKVPLADVSVLYDSLHQTPQYSENGYPMVRVTDIKLGYLDLAKTKKVDESIYREFTKKYKPQIGDVVFSQVGAYGNSSYVNKTKAFCLGQNIVCISPKQQLLNSFYLYSCLNSPFVKQQIDACVGGSSQPTISLRNINTLQIPYLSLSIQNKIAAILSNYDRLIENNTRRIEILEEMARSLYDEWFVKFRFPGYEQTKMVDSELELIPEGWEVNRLDNALILQRGFDLPTKQRQESNVPVYASTGVTGTHNEAKVKAPGVVTGRSGSLGTVIYIDEDFWALNTTLWVKEFRRVTPLYAFYLLSNLRLEQFNSGAAVPTLNRNDVHSLQVVIPSHLVLEQFNCFVKPLFAMKKNLQTRNVNLRKTRDLLLPKLISGEIDVENLDIETEIAA